MRTVWKVLCIKVPDIEQLWPITAGNKLRVHKELQFQAWHNFSIFPPGRAWPAGGPHAPIEAPIERRAIVTVPDCFFQAADQTPSAGRLISSLEEHLLPRYNNNNWHILSFCITSDNISVAASLRLCITWPSNTFHLPPADLFRAPGGPTLHPFDICIVTHWYSLNLTQMGCAGSKEQTTLQPLHTPEHVKSLQDQVEALKKHTADQALQVGRWSRYNDLMFATIKCA